MFGYYVRYIMSPVSVESLRIMRGTTLLGGIFYGGLKEILIYFIFFRILYNFWRVQNGTILSRCFLFILCVFKFACLKKRKKKGFFHRKRGSVKKKIITYGRQKRPNSSPKYYAHTTGQPAGRHVYSILGCRKVRNGKFNKQVRRCSHHRSPL